VPERRSSPIKPGTLYLRAWGYTGRFEKPSAVEEERFLAVTDIFLQE